MGTATLTMRSLVLAALVIGSSNLAGCIVEAAPAPVYADGYEPMYYDGYVVYYDDVGRPFYYVGGAIVWIAPTVPVYAALVDHWRLHGPAYRRWHAHDGYRYRSYRRPRR